MIIMSNTNIDFSDLKLTLDNMFKEYKENYIYPNVEDGHCIRCGYCVDDYPNFCPNCGNKLRY